MFEQTLAGRWRLLHAPNLTGIALALVFAVGCGQTGNNVSSTNNTTNNTNSKTTPIECGDNEVLQGIQCVCVAGFEFSASERACVAEAVPAVASAKGDLLIEEFYYSGAAPQGGTDHYFADQFIELVNTTDSPLDLSGVMVANAFGSAGEINPGMEPDSYAQSHPEQVVLSSAWRIPSGTRLEPGAHLVLAQDGTNHRPFSTVDLSGAGFETYVAASGGDDDHPTVRNLEEVVFNGGYDWLISVFGPSVVVIEAGTPLGTEPGPSGDLATVPAAAILDAVDAVMDEASGDFKRLPVGVDAGFAWVSGTYVGESLHRRQNDDGTWQDSDDSGADFYVGAPDPGRAPDTDGVFGDPWLELGTGAQEFAALSDGDSIELVAGIQGGWHLDTSVRFGGFGPDGVLLVYHALNESAEHISLTTQALLAEASVLEEEDGWARVGDRIVLEIADPSEVVGSTIVLRVTAGLGGQTWSDERRVVVADAE